MLNRMLITALQCMLLVLGTGCMERATRTDRPGTARAPMYTDQHDTRHFFGSDEETEAMESEEEPDGPAGSELAPAEEESLEHETSASPGRIVR